MALAIRTPLTWQQLLLRSRPFLVYTWLALVLAAWGIAAGHITSAAAISLFGGGLIAWTLLEYWLHRAMHMRPLWAGMGRFQDEVHLRHHREPDDIEHAVISLRGSIPLAVLLYLPAWGLFGAAGGAVFHAGLITGYRAYEFVHMASHARWRPALLRPLMRYHVLHHYADDHRTFGVTTPVWDIVFGTGYRPKARMTKPE